MPAQPTTRVIPTDAVLIAQSRRDPEAFATVFDRHHDRIAAYVRRRLPSDGADDVVADTFVAAFQQRDGFRDTYESALPWLYGIATNLIRAHVRTERRRLRAHAELAGREAGTSIDQGSEARLDAKGEAARLAAALAELPQRDRDAVLLLAWGELSYEEIAVALGIPTGTVRSRISRVRRRLGSDPAASEPSNTSPNHTAEELA